MKKKSFELRLTVTASIPHVQNRKKDPLIGWHEELIQEILKNKTASEAIYWHFLNEFLNMDGSMDTEISELIGTDLNDAIMEVSKNCRTDVKNYFNQLYCEKSVKESDEESELVDIDANKNYLLNRLNRIKITSATFTEIEKKNE